MDYIIVYDTKGPNFFFIVKSAQWGFLTTTILSKDQPQQEILRLIESQAGVKTVKSLKKVDDALHDIYMVETNMNLPIHIASEYSTYGWEKVEDVASKLEDPVLQSVFVEAVEFLKNA